MTPPGQNDSFAFAVYNLNQTRLKLFKLNGRRGTASRSKENSKELYVKYTASLTFNFRAFL